MKKLLYLLGLILIWLINVDAGDKTEWYVTFYEDENTIHKCGRDMYNEYRELIKSEPTEKDQVIYMNYQFNESVHYTENYKEYELKTLPIYIY